MGDNDPLLGRCETQPLRGLIPLLLDAQAAEPMVAGVRLQEFQPSPDGPVLCGREG